MIVSDKDCEWMLELLGEKLIEKSDTHTDTDRFVVSPHRLLLIHKMKKMPYREEIWRLSP